MLAYIDSRAGLVPCKVLRVDLAEGSRTVYGVTVRVTSRRFAAYGYPCGAVETRTGSFVVPRRAVYRRRGEVHPRILPYDWGALAAQHNIPAA